jgi:hypothetical protein
MLALFVTLRLPEPYIWTFAPFDVRLGASLASTMGGGKRVSCPN